MSIQAAFVVPHPPLLVPAVGRGKEHRVAATDAAYREVAGAIAKLAPDVALILSPHATVYSDYIHIASGKRATGSFAAFGAPEARFAVDYDTELIETIEALAAASGIPAGTQGAGDRSLDHAVMVPLYYLEQADIQIPIVRISVSGLSPIEHYRFGRAAARAVAQRNRRAVVLASGDLSHRLKDEGPYGYAREGPAFDERMMDILARAAFDELLTFDSALAEGAGECGLRAFQMMAGMLDGLNPETRRLSYEGPFGVGYGVVAYRAAGEDDGRRFADRYEAAQKEKLARLRGEESPPVRLARLALETYLEHRRPLAELPEGLPPELTERAAGVFVSLKEDGQLRGCIGTIEPAEASIAAEIIRNAVSAGIGDPRFSPVQPVELSRLVYSVDVLGRPEPVRDRSELDPAKYGVIVRKGRKRGLLLPALEGVDTVDQQLAIALKKAGINPDAAYTIERFEVVRHQ